MRAVSRIADVMSSSSEAGSRGGRLLTRSYNHDAVLRILMVFLLDMEDVMESVRKRISSRSIAASSSMPNVCMLSLKVELE